jgi:hypothetical protein
VIANNRADLARWRGPARITKPIGGPGIYFVLGGGKVKIGQAVDVGKRLRELRSMSPVPLKLHHGEWFEAQDVLAALDRLHDSHIRRNELEIAFHFAAVRRERNCA